MTDQVVAKGAFSPNPVPHQLFPQPFVEGASLTLGLTDQQGMFPNPIVALYPFDCW